MPTGLAPDRPRSAHAQPSSAAATSGPSEGEASSARRIGESLAPKQRGWDESERNHSHSCEQLDVFHIDILQTKLDRAMMSCNVNTVTAAPQR